MIAKEKCKTPTQLQPLASKMVPCLQDMIVQRDGTELVGVTSQDLI